MGTGSGAGRAVPGEDGGAAFASPLRTLVKIPSVKHGKPSSAMEATVQAPSTSGWARFPGLYVIGFLGAAAAAWMLWPQDRPQSPDPLDRAGLAALRTRSTMAGGGLFGQASASEGRGRQHAAPTTQRGESRSAPRVRLADYIVVIGQEPDDGDTGPSVHQGVQ